MCGDQYPIISNSEFSGLITAFTSVNAKEVITKIRKILKIDPNFFQFILKIIPIDFVCETNLDMISQMIQNNYKDYVKKSDSFMVDLNRRNNENVERMRYIEKIANFFINKVDLDNPDIIIKIEILGSTCGISFLKPGHILRLSSNIPMI